MSIRLLTNQETAEILGVTTHTLDQWRWKRKGPPSTKVGGAVRYAEAGLLAWIESRTLANAMHQAPSPTRQGVDA